MATWGLPCNGLQAASHPAGSSNTSRCTMLQKQVWAHTIWALQQPRCTYTFFVNTCSTWWPWLVGPLKTRTQKLHFFTFTFNYLRPFSKSLINNCSCKIVLDIQAVSTKYQTGKIIRLIPLLLPISINCSESYIFLNLTVHQGYKPWEINTTTSNSKQN